MLAKATCFALVAGAAAFSAGPAMPLRQTQRAGVTMMAEGVARRDAVAGAALAAGVAVVAPQAASARGKDGKETSAFAGESYSKYQKGRPRNQAPVIEIFEELGCSRPKKDYKGALTGTYDDNLCLKVKSKAIAADIRAAEAVFAKVRN